MARDEVPLYDAIQMAAILVVCSRCGRSYYMTKPGPLCIRCRRMPASSGFVGPRDGACESFHSSNISDPTPTATCARCRRPRASHPFAIVDVGGPACHGILR